MAQSASVLQLASTTSGADGLGSPTAIVGGRVTLPGIGCTGLGVGAGAMSIGAGAGSAGGAVSTGAAAGSCAVGVVCGSAARVHAPRARANTRRAAAWRRRMIITTSLAVAQRDAAVEDRL